MKKIFIYCLLIIQYFIYFPSLAATFQNDIITGSVIDEKGLPVPNIKVSVDGSEFYTSGADGKFKMHLKAKLEMPFDVNISKAGYRMLEFSFSDEDNEIEVIVRKAGQGVEEGVAVRLFDEKNAIIKNVKATIDGALYTSDAAGNILVKNKFSDKSKVLVDGYELFGITFNDKGKYYKVSERNKSLEVPEIAEVDELVEAKMDSDPDTLSQEMKNKKAFEQYKGGFDELNNEITAERIRVEGNNKKIRDEIISITDRLKNEKNLSKEQRKELQKYVEKLENTMIENAIAFQKSQQRTNFLISRLKNIIMEKDSINIKALQRIKVVEKENRITQRKFKRNLIVFSIITFALLLLAIVFYSIAVKMRKQKRALMKSNEEMQGIKDHLTQSLLIIEDQKKQLNGH